MARPATTRTYPKESFGNVTRDNKHYMQEDEETGPPPTSILHSSSGEPRDDGPEPRDGSGPTANIRRWWNYQHGDSDQQPTGPYRPEEYQGQDLKEYQPRGGCGGHPPPPCNTPSQASPDYRNMRDNSYYPSDTYAPSYSTNPCSEAGSVYAWSALCTQPTPLGASCNGAALCTPTNAHTTALATCTAWGWVATDGCTPVGCSTAPTSQLATFANCKTPGVLGQECRGSCQGPSVGGPLATCTPGGWVISGPLCDINACEATPSPCDSNATCTDERPPLTGATCACKDGFTGSGLPGECTEINGCAVEPSPCDINADCIDSPPPSTGATCRCKEGYIGAGTPNTCVEAEDGCTPANNPCSPNATCTDRDPPSTGADCVCNPNFSGDGFTAGTGCVQCTGTKWSPGGNVSCSDFSQHSQYFGSDPTVSQARSLRGLATDGTSLYVGMIQGTNSADVIKVTAETTSFLIGNGPTPITTSTNPYFNVGVIARIGGTPQGPKGLTLDDAGYVYHTSNNGRVYGRDPNTADLALLAQTYGGPSGTDLGPTPAALAFKRLSGVPYLYACVEGNPVISRLEIKYNAAGQPYTFAPAPAVGFSVPPAPNGCRGISIEDDGTLYYTAVPPGGTVADYYVAKVAPDGTELARRTVPGAFGVVHYNGKLYVTQYLSTNTVAGTSTGSGVAVLRSSDVTFITTLKPPADLVRVFQEDDSGYSGIAVSPTGMLYVADQIWKRVGTGGSPTAPNTPLPFLPSPVSPSQSATNVTSGLWLFDRVLQRQV